MLSFLFSYQRSAISFQLYKLKNVAGSGFVFNELSAVSFQLCMLKDVTDSGMAVK